MKKSSIWTILVLAVICALVLICVFIWRNTTGSRIHLEHYPFYAASDSADADGQNNVSSTNSSNKRININTADWEILALLPGIGEVLAKRIVDFRNKYGPFVSIEDLLKVPGVGEKKLKDINSYITVGGQK